jgi:hypothetical protein
VSSSGADDEVGAYSGVETSPFGEGYSFLRNIFRNPFFELTPVLHSSLVALA